MKDNRVIFTFKNIKVQKDVYSTHTHTPIKTTHKNVVELLELQAMGDFLPVCSFLHLMNFVPDIMYSKKIVVLSIN